MKNKTTAGLLAILLGGLGIHKFYLEQTLAGVLYLLFMWTGIPAILGLIDGIILLSMSDEDFNDKYNNKQTSTANETLQYDESCSRTDNSQTSDINNNFVAQPTQPAPPSVAEILISYKQLLDNQIITQEEFDALKHRVLSKRG